MNLIENTVNRNKSVDIVIKFWNKNITPLGYSKIRANSPERINAIRKIIKLYGGCELRKVYRIIKENKQLANLPWFNFNFLLKDGSIDKLLKGVYSNLYENKSGFTGESFVNKTIIKL